MTAVGGTLYKTPRGVGTWRGHRCAGVGGMASDWRPGLKGSDGQTLFLPVEEYAQGLRFAGAIGQHGVDVLALLRLRHVGG